MFSFGIGGGVIMSPLMPEALGVVHKDYACMKGYVPLRTKINKLTGESSPHRWQMWDSVTLKWVEIDGLDAALLAGQLPVDNYLALRRENAARRERVIAEINAEFEPPKVPARARKCGRCGGHGRIPQYRHIENGICFECRGCGYSRRGRP